MVRIEGGGLAHVADAQDVLRLKRAGQAAGQRDREAGAEGGVFEVFE
jgi:hypothetical protein